MIDKNWWLGALDFHEAFVSFLFFLDIYEFYDKSFMGGSWTLTNRWSFTFCIGDLEATKGLRG